MRLIYLVLSLLFSTATISAESDLYLDGFMPQCSALMKESNYQSKRAGTFKYIIQSNDGWLFRTGELIENYRTSPQAMVLLSKMNRTLEKMGTKLILVVTPNRGLVYPDRVPSAANYNFAKAAASYKAYLQEFRNAGVTTVDMTPVLNSQVPGLYNRRDVHWTSTGAVEIAKLTAKAIKQQPMYPSLKKTEFVSRYAGLSHMDGLMQRVYADICQRKYPVEYFKQYATEKVALADDSSLFADEQDADQVMAVGTSFSTQESPNFIGFVNEHSSLEVVNHALTGGNVLGAIETLFKDEEFRRNPPKILLWELIAHQQDINNPDTYRILEPQLKGYQCNLDNIRMSNEVTITQGAQEILFNGDGKFQKLKSGDHFLELEFTDRKIFEFELKAWQLERRREKFKVWRPKKVENDGRFLVNLSTHPELKDMHFVSLELALKGTDLAGSKVKVKLCEKPEQA